MMDYEGGDLLLAGATCAGGRAATWSLWVQAVGGSLSGLAPWFQWHERVRGDYSLQYTLYKSTPLPLPLWWTVCTDVWHVCIAGRSVEKWSWITSEIISTAMLTLTLTLPAQSFTVPGCSGMCSAGQLFLSRYCTWYTSHVAQVVDETKWPSSSTTSRGNPG